MVMAVNEPLEPVVRSTSIFWASLCVCAGCIESNQPAVCVFLLLPTWREVPKSYQFAAPSFQRSSSLCVCLSLSQFSLVQLSSLQIGPNSFSRLSLALYAFLSISCARIAFSFRVSAVLAFFMTCALEFPQGNFDFGVFRSFWFFCWRLTFLFSYAWYISCNILWWRRRTTAQQKNTKQQNTKQTEVRERKKWIFFYVCIVVWAKKKTRNTGAKCPIEIQDTKRFSTGFI